MLKKKSFSASLIQKKSCFFEFFLLGGALFYVIMLFKYRLTKQRLK